MLLSRYKSGKLPKTFKIIPTLRDWEEVLYITDPASWTPQAVYQATRIFTSNLKAKMAQRYDFSDEDFSTSSFWKELEMIFKTQKS